MTTQTTATDTSWDSAHIYSYEPDKDALILDAFVEQHPDQPVT